jgi:hypothetical protein
MSDPASPDPQPLPSEANPASLPPEEKQLAGGGTGVPLSSNVPAVTAPTPAPQPTANPVSVRHSLIGRAIEHAAHAIEGKQVVGYQPDANGDLQPVVGPRKPGGIFRDILIGALAGGAAGSTADPAQGFAGGAVRGAVAGNQAVTGMNQQRAANLKQQAQSKINSDNKEQQRILQQATVARGTLSVLSVDHHANLMNDRQISSVNDSNSKMRQVLLDNGGSLAHLPGPNGEELNGKADNGGELEKLFQQNPETVMKAPDGFHRIPLISLDTKGLTNENGRWVDQTGKEVDLADRTTFHLVDVPESLWGQNLSLDSGVINAIAGRPLAKGKPGSTFTTTLGSMYGLKIKNLSDIGRQTQALYSPPKTDQEADSLEAQLADIRDRQQSDPASVTEDEKHLLAAKSNILDRYNQQRQQREKVKQQAEIDKAVAIEKAKEGDKTPTNIGAASAAVTTARIAYRNDPSFENAKKLKEAQEYLTDQRNAEAGKKLDELQAQRTIDQRDEDVVAQSLASGDPTSLKDVASMRGDQRVRIFAKAKKLNPDFNTTTAKVKADTLEAFTNGKQADQIQSFNTFLGHAADASDVVNDYRTTGSPLINKPLNWIRKNAVGDPRYSQFVTSLAPVRDEFMTFLQNNHALTESDKKAADTIMSDTSSPAQIQAALKQMGNTSFIRLGALNTRYKRVMGEDFPDLLSVDSVQDAGKLGLGQQAAKFRAGGQVTGARTRPENGQQPPPSGATHAVRVNGKIVGYTTDGKTMTPAQ